MYPEDAKLGYGYARERMLSLTVENFTLFQWAVHIYFMLLSYYLRESVRPRLPIGCWNEC